ncbi:MAG: hypothetical protein MJ252_10050 [archaeon]|nr:hypothetical protein [archaeon]
MSLKPQNQFMNPRSSNDMKESSIINNLNVSKESKSLNIDIDSICEELYSVGDNKKRFLQIMSDLEKEVLGSDVDLTKSESIIEPKKSQTINNSPSPQVNNSYDNYDFKIEEDNTPYTQKESYQFNGIQEENKNKFSLRKTVPEGEFLQYPTLQQSGKHKNYTDVNANSNFYYPKENNALEINKGQWTNRANQIFLSSQSNGFQGMQGELNDIYNTPQYNNPMPNNNPSAPYYPINTSRSGFTRNIISQMGSSRGPNPNISITNNTLGMGN